MASVRVDITEGRKIVETYYINRLNIAAKARQMEMTGKILEDDSISESTKIQKFNCAALASTLVDKDGKLMYPGDEDYEVIFNEMDVEVFTLLVAEYVEINPIETKLKAKKKKS